MYVQNDAKSDCLDSRYNRYLIVLDAKTFKRHARHGRWKDTKRTSESLEIPPFQGSSPTPLAVNDFTGSHLGNGPLIESEIRIDTDSVMNLRRGIEVHFNLSQVIKNQGQLSQDGLSKSPYTTEMYL